MFPPHIRVSHRRREPLGPSATRTRGQREPHVGHAVRTPADPQFDMQGTVAVGAPLSQPRFEFRGQAQSVTAPPRGGSAVAVPAPAPPPTCTRLWRTRPGGRIGSILRAGSRQPHPAPLHAAKSDGTRQHEKSVTQGHVRRGHGQRAHISHQTAASSSTSQRHNVHYLIGACQ